MSVFRITGNVRGEPKLYELAGSTPKVWVVVADADVVTDDRENTWTKCLGGGVFYCQADIIGVVRLDYL